MSKYLVTGGAGFIGANLVQELTKGGHEVRVVDNLSTGNFDNIKDLISDIEFICGDLSNYKIARQCVEGVEYILHNAAIPSVPRSVEDPITTNESIVTSTVNLFKAAVEAKSVKRIVQAASSSAYGDTPTLPKVEDMIPNPLSPYAVAKLTQEYYANAFYNMYGIEIFSLRYFNIFGPKQDPNSVYSAVIPKFISLMLRGQRPVIFGDGLTSRDFTYIENVISANLLASTCQWRGRAEVINIGCGKNITLNDLVRNINQILNTSIEPKYENTRMGDVKNSLADITKARKILGYEVKIGVYEGLSKLINMICNNR